MNWDRVHPCLWNLTLGGSVVKADTSMWACGAVIAAAVLAVVGCASTPIPNEKIAVAKASVQRAEQSGAPEFAPVELAAARDKLSRAEKSASAREAQPATMLAERREAGARR